MNAIIRFASIVAISATVWHFGVPMRNIYNAVGALEHASVKTNEGIGEMLSGHNFDEGQSKYLEGEREQDAQQRVILINGAEIAVRADELGFKASLKSAD
jgi:hypothetical protein